MGAGIPVPHAAKVPLEPFGSEQDARLFFGVSEMRHLKVLDARGRRFFRLVLPADTYIARHVGLQGVKRVSEIYDAAEWCRWVIPQMVYKHLFWKEPLIT